MKILFIAGYGPVAQDPVASEQLYATIMGIRFEKEDDNYLHTSTVNGCNHFAIWPLSQAAESCFGDSKWPEDIPAPTSWIEYDVDDVANASAELKAAGYQLLIENRAEPWGQIVTRFISPEGILVGITHTPWMRSGAASNMKTD